MESNYANYDYVEAYDATMYVWERALRKVKFPVAKLGEAAHEAFTVDYHDLSSFIITTHFVLLNRKDVEAVKVMVAVAVDQYPSRLSPYRLEITVEDLRLETEQEVAGFASLMKRGGRTKQDILDYIRGVRMARPRPMRDSRSYKV